MAFKLNRSRKEPMSEINVTPFVDVMLVLLIIFMVTAPLLTVGVQVDLPESAADSGKSTWTPTVNKGAVTIKIIKSTNITSTNGVTFISLIGSFFERLKLKAILNY